MDYKNIIILQRKSFQVLFNKNQEILRGWFHKYECKDKQKLEVVGLTPPPLFRINI